MKDKINHIFGLLFSKELGILPSALAFSFFLSIIPIITLIVYLLTSFNFSIDALHNFFNKTFTPGVVDLLKPVFSDTINLSSIITIVMGLIISINGCSSIIVTSNTIYDVKNASFVKRLIKSVFITVIMIILFAFVLIVPLFGKLFILLLGEFGDLINNNEFLINVIYSILQVPISLLVIFMFIKLVYKIAPDQKIKSKYVTKGSVFTTISWLILTVIYSYYINNIARYDLVYGNLANIVILLLWFYLLAYIFVLGMIINRESMNVSIEKTNTIKLDEIREKVKHNMTK